MHDLLFMDFKSHVMLEDSKTQPSPVNISLCLKWVSLLAWGVSCVGEGGSEEGKLLVSKSKACRVSTGIGLMNSGVVERPRKCRGKCSRGAA